MTRIGVRALDFANWAGGRVFDLPPAYQEKIALAVRTAHPKTIRRELQLLMASVGYVGSSHPLIRGLDEFELREFHLQLAGKAVTDGAG